MRLEWDQVGQKKWETGTDRGVLFPMNNDGTYAHGEAWNGITGVTESPSGAEANDFYADNIKYASIRSAEEYGATVTAYTYPASWPECDGSKEIAPGVFINQQTRRKFGLTYRNLVGNDVAGQDYGYKIHLVYGASASPSERSRSTVNDSPELVENSWEINTDPVDTGIAGTKKTAHVEIDSTTVDAAKLAAFEDILYGSADAESTLPSPAEVYNHFKADGGDNGDAG